MHNCGRSRFCSLQSALPEGLVKKLIAIPSIKNEFLEILPITLVLTLIATARDLLVAEKRKLTNHVPLVVNLLAVLRTVTLVTHGSTRTIRYDD